MELNPEQLKKFKEIHGKYECFSGLSDDLVNRIANGVANYYLALYKGYIESIGKPITTTIHAHICIHFVSIGKEDYYLTDTRVISL